VKAAPWDLEAGVRLASTTGDIATLRRIAASNDAPYASRTEAARVLAKTNTKGLGSAELDALASESVLSISETEKAFFYEARLKAAAQTKDSNSRIALLRAAIAVNPTPTPPRLQLFETLFQAGQFDQAVSVFRVPPSSLARDLATAFRKLGDLDQAKRYLLMVARIDPKQNVKSEIAALEAELQRIQENQRLMPHVHDNVDQTERVRPRI
jgi:tetratricopeptide (TPR) repeat protein